MANPTFGLGDVQYGGSGREVLAGLGAWPGGKNQRECLVSERKQCSLSYMLKRPALKNARARGRNAKQRAAKGGWRERRMRNANRADLKRLSPGRSAGLRRETVREPPRPRPAPEPLKRIDSNLAAQENLSPYLRARRLKWPKHWH
jgi:hypothetical protein